MSLFYTVSLAFTNKSLQLSPCHYSNQLFSKYCRPCVWWMACYAKVSRCKLIFCIYVSLSLIRFRRDLAMARNTSSGARTGAAKMTSTVMKSIGLRLSHRQSTRTSSTRFFMICHLTRPEIQHRALTLPTCRRNGRSHQHAVRKFYDSLDAHSTYCD